MVIDCILNSLRLRFVNLDGCRNILRKRSKELRGEMRMYQLKEVGMREENAENGCAGREQGISVYTGFAGWPSLRKLYV